jgi:hypothetical protein
VSGAAKKGWDGGTVSLICHFVDPFNFQNASFAQRCTIIHR